MSASNHDICFTPYAQHTKTVLLFNAEIGNCFSQNYESESLLWPNTKLQRSRLRHFSLDKMLYLEID